MKVFASLYLQYDEDQTPYPQDDEEDGNQEKLYLHTLHSGLPVIGEYGSILVHLQDQRRKMSLLTSLSETVNTI